MELLQHARRRRIRGPRGHEPSLADGGGGVDRVLDLGVEARTCVAVHDDVVYVAGVGMFDCDRDQVVV